MDQICRHDFDTRHCVHHLEVDTMIYSFGWYSYVRCVPSRCLLIFCFYFFSPLEWKILIVSVMQCYIGKVMRLYKGQLWEQTYIKLNYKCVNALFRASTENTNRYSFSDRCWAIQFPEVIMHSGLIAQEGKFKKKFGNSRLAKLIIRPWDPKFEPLVSILGPPFIDFSM